VYAGVAVAVKLVQVNLADKTETRLSLRKPEQIGRGMTPPHPTVGDESVKQGEYAKDFDRWCCASKASGQYRILSISVSETGTRLDNLCEKIRAALIPKVRSTDRGEAASLGRRFSGQKVPGVCRCRVSSN
jgi:hypothetical protein